MTTLSTFYPAYSLITGITLGVQTVISFGEAHDFTVGEIISIRVSPPYGTVELNNMQRQVIAMSSTSITIDVDSRFFTPFINAGNYEPQVAMVVPSGTGNIVSNNSLPIINLQDAFDNKPPI